jgi:hypothetical protein
MPQSRKKRQAARKRSKMCLYSSSSSFIPPPLSVALTLSPFFIPPPSFFLPFFVSIGPDSSAQDRPFYDTSRKKAEKRVRTRPHRIFAKFLSSVIPQHTHLQETPCDEHQQRDPEDRPQEGEIGPSSNSIECVRRKRRRHQECQKQRLEDDRGCKSMTSCVSAAYIRLL